MSQEFTPKQIQVVLKQKNRVEKFNEIKQFHEINSAIDVVRFCIDEVYLYLKDERIFIREEIKNVLDNLLSNDYLKAKNLVFTQNDIINLALHQWIQSRKTEINLHSFSFRRELPKEEQQIANVFIEQQINYDKGLTLQDVITLSDLEKKLIERILDKFERNGLLISNIESEKKYFYAPPL